MKKFIFIRGIVWSFMLVGVAGLSTWAAASSFRHPDQELVPQETQANVQQK